jgi:Helicase HerA, central domain
MSEQPAASESIDRPACFYLGREYDLATKSVLSDKLIMYDARNLTTHGVIVGMTGSGKTGLSIALLEEAAIDGIPAVIIDPKGDLTNLLLQFPDLEPRYFAEWLNPDDAKSRNLSVDDYAKQLSERWKKGIIESGQQPERVREMSQHTDFRIYTPGSESGLGLSILRTFTAPKGKIALEDLTQKVSATATALLGLSGISADPVQSREHVLITHLINHAWGEGRDLDLVGLIGEIQKPSISSIGAYNLETFFPARERMKFAGQLNNMLASPVFATWSRGEPLDLASMLYRNGRPQHLIFYLAHLDDNQRMFFTTLLLEEMLAWTRRQSGTSSLRALLYFDEVFGYLPPHPANPPSKQPLLTLLKQGRAFGVGVLLATQNPVDLDYKALSNAGTWFVGKLQTERDKARLLDGLESVAAEHGTLTDRAYLEKVIASLGNRVFLMHDITQGALKLFMTRWALTFLRGPMTREEVARVVKPIKARDEDGGFTPVKLCNHCGTEQPPGVGSRCPSCGKNPWEPVGGSAPMAGVARAGAIPLAAQTGQAAPVIGGTQPMLGHDVQQFYLPVAAGSRKPGHELEYQPWLLGFAEVVFLIDRRTGSEHRVHVRLVARAPQVGHPVDWEHALSIAIEPVTKAEASATWAAVPDSIDTGKKLKAIEKAFGEFLFGGQKLSLHENRDLELVSAPGESMELFRLRCRKAADEAKGRALELERIKFKPRLEAAHQSTGKGREDRIARLEADYQAKQDEIAELYRRLGEEADELQIKPRKMDIRVTHFGIAWAPFWVARGETR